MTAYIELAYAPKYGCSILGDNEGYLSILPRTIWFLSDGSDSELQLHVAWVEHPAVIVPLIEQVKPLPPSHWGDLPYMPQKRIDLEQIKFNIWQDVFSIWAAFWKPKLMWYIWIPEGVGLVHPARVSRRIARVQAID